MYLIKRIYLFVFLLLTFLFIIGLGIIIYFTATSVNTGNAIDMKFLGERVLFIAILFSIVLVFAFHYLVRKKEQNIYEELDKIREYSQKGNINKNSIKKLGTLGDKIMLINEKLSDLNSKRVEKITALSKEINFLYNLIDVPVFSVNMKGEIDKVSKAFLKIIDYDKQDIIDKLVNDFIQDINFNSLTQELEQSKMVPLKSPIITDSEKEQKEKYFVFYPIFNIKNILSNSICIMVDKKEYEKLQTANHIHDNSEDKSLSPLLNKLLDLYNPS